MTLAPLLSRKRKAAVAALAPSQGISADPEEPQTEATKEKMLPSFDAIKAKTAQGLGYLSAENLESTKTKVLCQCCGSPMLQLALLMGGFSPIRPSLPPDPPRSMMLLNANLWARPPP